MKRTIKVIATYDLGSTDLKELQITPKENVKKMVREEMFEVFGWDEGFLGLEVEVLDE
jgi:hypothetical protein